MSTIEQFLSRPWQIVVCAAIAGMSCAAAGQNPDRCAPQWEQTFGSRPYYNDHVSSMIMFEGGEGGGASLYIGGHFTIAGSSAVNRIAKWDEQTETWRPVGAGFPAGGVYALASFDDGSGPALYAGGSFRESSGAAGNLIAKWDGENWLPLGTGIQTATAYRIEALSVFDDGNGPALYAAGYFSRAGGNSASNIARWDGTSWSSLGEGLNNMTFALMTFDDGDGSALYAGGKFHDAGDVDAHLVAKWDGAKWSALGDGLSDGSDTVFALAAFDDGTGGGTQIYAGGDFENAEGPDYIAKWDGENWFTVGDGLPHWVTALTVFDDGTGRGAALYAAVQWENDQDVARWNGVQWEFFGTRVNGSLSTLGIYQNPHNASTLLISGDLYTQAFPIGGLLRYSASSASWIPFDPGLDKGVAALTVFQPTEDSRPALIAGGDFLSAEGKVLNHVGRWDGDAWSALDTGMNGAVKTFAALDDDNDGKNELFAGGTFTTAGDVEARRIARWNGTKWSSLAAGVGIQPSDEVNALAVFDDGRGEALYVGGSFLTVDGILAYNIARWDGVAWSPVNGGTNHTVDALAVYDDALYVAGKFSAAGNVPSQKIARWDGAEWSALGKGVTGQLVLTMVTYDNGLGGGPALYLGGYFSAVGDVPASRIAKWDGTNWSQVGNGIDGSFSTVTTLTTFKLTDASVPALYVGGYFQNIGGVATRSVAKWDGLSWSRLGAGIDVLGQYVSALTAFDDGSGRGPALYVGGVFNASPAGDSYLARWQFCPVEVLFGDLDGDGLVNGQDVMRMFALWGECSSPCPPNCAADLAGPHGPGADCNIDVHDLFMLLRNWSP